MTRTVNEEIELYFKFIESFKDSIVKLNSDNYLPHLKRLACVGLLDTLAKCVANPRFSNYKRFTSFIKHFCEWDDNSKISLPHLVRFLKLVPSPEFEPLRKFAISKIEKWRHGETQYLDSDPSYKEVFALWPKDKEHKEPIEKISLQSLTHLTLLWKLRNSIVHELQLPGYGIDALVTTKPGYHSMTDHRGSNPIETWELVYPVPFVINLIENGIKNLKIYCQENKLNPNDSYKFGSYWIEELN